MTSPNCQKLTEPDGNSSRSGATPAERMNNEFVVSVSGRSVWLENIIKALDAAESVAAQLAQSPDCAVEALALLERLKTIRSEALSLRIDTSEGPFDIAPEWRRLLALVPKPLGGGPLHH